MTWSAPEDDNDDTLFCLLASDVSDGGGPCFGCMIPRTEISALIEAQNIGQFERELDRVCQSPGLADALRADGRTRSVQLVEIWRCLAQWLSLPVPPAASRAETMLGALRSAQEHILGEYRKLCGRLDLTPVELDVYEHIEGSRVETRHGTKLGNATAAYNRGLIVLPLYNAAAVRSYVFPGRGLTLLADQWPVWRLELWREVIHQVQDQQLHTLLQRDGAEGHRVGWNEAVALVAERIGVVPSMMGGI